MENIVYVAVPRDWFDYLATGATLLLSVIAVIIAVSTARRQNRIALFEKRDHTFKYLKDMINTWACLCEMVRDCKDFADFGKFVSIYAFFHTEYDSISCDASPTKLVCSSIIQIVKNRNLEELERTPLLFKVSSITEEKIKILLSVNNHLSSKLHELITDNKLNSVDVRKGFKTVEDTFYENMDFVYELKKQVSIGKFS